jgi:putative ABC transport system substrate-binding protein
MGFIEGRNVTIVHRPDHPSSAALAADLVRQGVSLIFAPTAGAARAAKAATQTIPIVFFTGLDPIESGLVTSLNRPGGNVTGVAMLAIDIGPKRLDLLHKLVPTAPIIGMLTGPPGNLATEAYIRDMPSAAKALGLRVLPLHAQTDDDIAAAFGTLVEEKGGALLISAIVGLDARRDQVIALAARHAIPTMFFYGSSVRLGGLMSYGPDVPDATHRAGVYAGRILKGEKPTDLPVQQSTRFKLAFNLKTAKALGLEIPPTILALADEVIE